MECPTFQSLQTSSLDRVIQLAQSQLTCKQDEINSILVIWSGIPGKGSNIQVKKDYMHEVYSTDLGHQTSLSRTSLTTKHDLVVKMFRL